MRVSSRQRAVLGAHVAAAGRLHVTRPFSEMPGSRIGARALTATLTTLGLLALTACQPDASTYAHRPEVERARQTASEASAAAIASLSRVGEVAAEAVRDSCEAGDDNWKTRADYAFQCQRVDAVILAPYGGSTDEAIGDMTTRLSEIGCPGADFTPSATPAGKAVGELVTDTMRCGDTVISVSGYAEPSADAGIGLWEPPDGESVEYRTFSSGDRAVFAEIEPVAWVVTVSVDYARQER